MSGPQLGIHAFSYGVDKVDKLPDGIFLTPKERKQRREQERREREEGQRHLYQGSDQQGNDYDQYSRGYGANSSSQNPNFERGRDQGFSGRQDTHQIEDDPYSMQGDNYYGGGGGGRRAYNPSDYEPRYGGYDDGYGRDQYGTSSARDPYARPSSAGRVDRYRPASYDDAYDDYDDDYDRRESRRDRQSSKSKSRRSRSRSGIRGKLDKNFDKTERGLTSGALGALAGGLVGHEVGKGPLATVAGVVLGGLGANAYEARHERHKSEREGRRSKSTDARGGGYEDDYRRRSRGGRGDGGDYDDYDSYEDERSSPQRLTGSSRSDRRRSKKDNDPNREEVEKHFGWGNTLKS